MNEEKKEPPKEDDDDEVHKARMSLWNMMQHHFSSEPLSFADATYPQPSTKQGGARNSLTVREVAYLHSLLKSDNLDHLNCAIRRLSDNNVFVPSTTLVDTSTEKELVQPPRSNIPRRDSLVQQHMFRLHEITNHRPSTLMRRLSMRDRDRQNSIIDYGDNEDAATSTTATNTTTTVADDPKQYNPVEQWNSFDDVTSWLDGNQGVEVDDDGNPLPPQTQSPFRILGTSADDVSCHPHVLSPPLMEALLEFMPETLSSDYHFWLKYSMVRDGGGLFQLVKHVRTSQHTLLAIETTDGHVFGAFTLHPWRLSNQFYGSSNSFLWRLRHSRMTAAASAAASTTDQQQHQQQQQHVPSSLLEQAQMETELDIFPVSTKYATTGIQGCHLQHGLALGKSHLNDLDDEGVPILSSSPLSSYALFLRPDLRVGHTSASEAFGNPCLIEHIIGSSGDSSTGDAASSDSHAHRAQSFFEVANIEVWTLTPFNTEAEAEQAELSSFFLQDEARPLNVLNILVNGRDQGGIA